MLLAGVSVTHQTDKTIKDAETRCVRACALAAVLLGIKSEYKPATLTSNC